MVIEMMESVSDAIKSPWHMILFGAVVSLVSLGVAYVIFPENIGLVTVFLISLISAPFMLQLFKYDEWHEEKDLRDLRGFWEKFGPGNVVARQAKILLIYASLFVGMTAALSTAFWLLPESVAEKAFNDQTSQIEKISLTVGSFVSPGIFEKILLNNLVVLSVSFFFALLLGFGALFVISWNASVLAAAVGTVGKVSGAHIALATFLPHGVFEIAGYLMAAIAGGIISVAVMKRHNRLLGPILRDMCLFLVLAVGLIVVGAGIESTAV